jgi:hypothetical protein
MTASEFMQVLFSALVWGYFTKKTLIFKQKIELSPRKDEFVKSKIRGFVMLSLSKHDKLSMSYVHPSTSSGGHPLSP